MIDLEGKTALVTGAASGFGRGIAKTFVDAGARVGILDRDAHGADAAAAEFGHQAIGIEADITSQQDLTRAVQEFIDWSGHIDILVNNAGMGLPPTLLENVTEADFEQIFSVNMKGIYLTSKLVVPHMKAQQHGCILNIASTAGVSPRPGLTWYNASKGWVITATKSMAVELAANNIRVNALNPVAGDTPMLATFLGDDTPEMRQKFLASIPLGRFSTPQDLANAALYLCSDAASMVTGVAMEVDGGRCI